MKKLTVIAITLTAIGVAVKVGKDKINLLELRMATTESILNQVIQGRLSNE